MIIGASLNQYQITAAIGSGGMGEVFRARDTRLSRDVAVKVLPKDFVADADRLRRFEQEAKTLAALNHPNVLTVFDAGIHEGAPYLVSELLEGKTLREEMNGGALPVRKATDYALQIAHGLAAAHGKGVIHRDLKPENIFVTKDGRVKILDFGLAKLRNPSPDLRPPFPLGGERDEARGESDVPTIRMDGDTIVNSTEPGAVLGTPGYMSPEQVRGEAADHRSDIFAFGTILHEMFSGVHPFRRGTVVETMTAILKEEPLELTKSNPNLPPAVDRIVQRCLEKQPDNRFQSAKDLAFAFAEISSAHSPALTVKGSEKTAWKRFRTVPVLGALLFLVIGIAGVFGWQLFHHRTPITSLAVKPLDDFSGDTNQAYLSDGMTEALCAALGNISALRVPGRASVMRYKGSLKSIREMARELQVDAILGGSIQKAGNRLRATVVLVEAATDRHLWATTYERDLGDFFKVQTEVAQAIAAEIRVRLTPQDESLLANARATKAEAVEAYLKGRFYLSKGTKEGFEQALRSFNEAIRLDDKFAKAYSGMADAYMLAMGWFVEDAVAMSLGLQAATNAVALDATSAEAHTSLGGYYTALWRWADAEAAFDNALRLNGRYALGYLGYGNLRLLIGKGEEEGLNQFVRAQELEPGDPRVAAWLGWACVHLGRYDVATNYLNKALELDRNFWFAQQLLGLSSAFQGNYAEAIVWTEKAVQVSERNVEMLGTLGWVYGKAGDSAKAQAILNELLTTKQPRTASPWMVALVYLGLGQSEDAIKQLQEGILVRDPALMFLRLDRRFDPLRQDARFKEIMNTIGFTK